MPALSHPSDIIRFDLSLATYQAIGKFHAEIRFGVGDFDLFSSIPVLGKGVALQAIKTEGGYRVFRFDGAINNVASRAPWPIASVKVRIKQHQNSVKNRIDPWTFESEMNSWCKNAAGQPLEMFNPWERGGIVCVARDNVAERIGFWQLTAVTNP